MDRSTVSATKVPLYAQHRLAVESTRTEQRRRRQRLNESEVHCLISQYTRKEGIPAPVKTEMACKPYLPIWGSQGEVNLVNKYSVNKYSSEKK